MVTQGDQTIDAFQQYYARPPELTTKESFKLFLYNPKDGSVFGRTGPSWCKLYTLHNGLVLLKKGDLKIY